MHNVLIVDDEYLARSAIRHLGEWEVFDIDRIFEAADGEEALTLLETRPEIDIVITDMKMPEISGMELLQALKNRFEKKAIIIISGFTDFEYVRQGIKAKAVDYLIKPISAEDLNMTLAAAVDVLDEGEIPAEDSVTYPDTRTPGLIRNIQNYIELHHRDNITLQDLSEEFSVSREHLSRFFKKNTGENLFQYITKRRVEAAKQLLRKTDHSIKTVAYNLGYQDEHYFSKSFKRVTQESPTEYRNRINP